MPQAGLSESQLDEVWQEARYSRPRITGRVPAETPRRRQREVASWWDGEVPVPVPVRVSQDGTRVSRDRVRSSQGRGRAAVVIEDPATVQEPIATAERPGAAVDRAGAAVDRPGARDDDLLASYERPAASAERRTVTITGRGADPYRGARRRPPRSAHERVGFRPDRMAMWAVLLGVLLILVAATSSHAAMRHMASHASLRASTPLHAPVAPHSPLAH